MTQPSKVLMTEFIAHKTNVGVEQIKSLNLSDETLEEYFNRVSDIELHSKNGKSFANKVGAACIACIVADFGLAAALPFHPVIAGTAMFVIFSAAFPLAISADLGRIEARKILKEPANVAKELHDRAQKDAFSFSS